MKYTHIIWDFNGTLFDDVDAGIASVNKMLSDRGLKIISDKDEYREVFKFPIINYYRDLGFDFEVEPYEVLAPIWVELYNENSKSSTLCEGARDLLEYFKEKNIPQILLSATERNMLLGQIAGLGIREYFEDVLGRDNIHAYSKKDIATGWIKRQGHIKPLFIGDTEHDAQVARAVGADCILVTQGHQSKDTLLKCGYPVYNDLGEVMEILNF